MLVSNSLDTVIQKYKDIPDFCGIKILNVQTKTIANDQLLHVASVNGDLQSAEILINEGASINEKGENGFTPLHYAVEQGKTELVIFFIQHGADKNCKNDFCQTPAELADDLGEIEIKKILEKG
jgi:uncharacterized protein